MMASGENIIYLLVINMSEAHNASYPFILLWNKIMVLQSQIFYGWLSATLDYLVIYWIPISVIQWMWKSFDL